MTTAPFLSRSDDPHFIDQEIKNINDVTEKGLEISKLLFMQISVTSSHSEGRNVNQMSKTSCIISSFSPQTR